MSLSGKRKRKLLTERFTIRTNRWMLNRLARRARSGNVTLGHVVREILLKELRTENDGNGRNQSV